VSVSARFIRHGNDRDEPDLLYRLSTGKTLGIEVATAYYNDQEARADWTLARGVRPLPSEGYELRPVLMSPDDLICDRVQQELLDKCSKRYVGADAVWLCIHQDAGLSDQQSVSDCVQRLSIPADHRFDAMYLTYLAPTHEGGKLHAVPLFRREQGR
jgi:hypothetical protein